MKEFDKSNLCNMLHAVNRAENILVRNESRLLDVVLSNDHPLKSEVERQKSMLGDLTDLPPGHPLLLTLQTAKKNYEEQQELRCKEQEKTKNTNHVRKVRKQNKKQEQIIENDSNEEKRQVAIKKLNIGIRKHLDALEYLHNLVSQNEEILSIDPLIRSKVSKLKRMIVVSQRGISECRLKIMRSE